MDQNAVNAYLAANASYFPVTSINLVRDKLLSVDENKFHMLTAQSLKNPTVAWILAFFLGGLGIGRFYIGDVLLGILKLITGGGLGIWWFIDLFIITGSARQRNLAKIMQAPF